MICASIARSMIASLMGVLWLGSPLAASDQTAPPEAKLNAYDQMASLRELDRKCRFLSFYERVDLGPVLDEAEMALPEHNNWMEALASERGTTRALVALNMAKETSEAAAQKRIAGLECGSAQADAIAEPAIIEIAAQTALLLRYPPLVQRLEAQSKNANLRMPVGGEILTRTANRFGNQRDAFLSQVNQRVRNLAPVWGTSPPSRYWERMLTLISAGISENAARRKGYQFVFQQSGSVGSRWFDWLRTETGSLGGARLSVRDEFRVRTIGDAGEPIVHLATGLEGVDKQGRIVVMVNSVNTIGSLPDDLQAMIVYRRTDLLSRAWTKSDWRAGAEIVEAQRLSQNLCPAEMCFAFPSSVGSRLAHHLLQSVNRVEAEVFIGTKDAFPMPDTSVSSERDKLVSVLEMLKD